MSFADYLKISSQEIDQTLEIYFKEWLKKARQINPTLLPLTKAAINSVKGGKRLRGTLVKLGYEIANEIGKVMRGDILKVACAFEIFQAGILAHDDIIDQSLLRRGQPTLYRALGGDHYGISQSICLGDLSFFIAMDIIASSNFPDQNKNLALQSFIKSMTSTGLGEILDIELPKQAQVAEKNILTIFALKTAEYTITGPLQLGAILAGHNQKLLEAIANFGQNLGLAFQIQDDILGVFGKVSEMGKPATSDIEEGKQTLLVLKAFEKGSSQQKQFLKKCLGTGKISASQLEKVKQIFIDTGSLDYSKSQALKYVSEAKQLVPKITKQSAHQQLLNEMADLLIERKR